MVDDSELISRFKKSKNKKPIFYLEIDKISIKKFLKVWPKNLSMSTFN